MRELLKGKVLEIGRWKIKFFDEGLGRDDGIPFYDSLTITDVSDRYLRARIYKMHNSSCKPVFIIFPGYPGGYIRPFESGSAEFLDVHLHNNGFNIYQNYVIKVKELLESDT